MNPKKESVFTVVKPTEKKIEDYLHLYLGCDCEVEFTGHTTNRRVKLDAEILYDWFIHQRDFIDEETGKNMAKYQMVIKPILRPLSSMTEEEFNELEQWKIYQGHSVEDFAMIAAEATKWLLSKHFDIFGLIESGLALQSPQTTLPK